MGTQKLLVELSNDRIFLESSLAIYLYIAVKYLLCPRHSFSNSISQGDKESNRCLNKNVIHSVVNNGREKEMETTSFISETVVQ